MILGSYAIREARMKGDIIIEPFNEDQLGPNSYDVRLDKLVLRVLPNVTDYGHKFIDPRLPQKYDYCIIPEEGLVIIPNELWLGCTIEVAGSDEYVPMYDGRSTIGRMGLFSHVTAGFGDIGFKKTWTLELVPTIPFLLLPNMKIGQVAFHQVKEVDKFYDASHNYSGQNGPTPAKANNI